MTPQLESTFSLFQSSPWCVTAPGFADLVERVEQSPSRAAAIAPQPGESVHDWQTRAESWREMCRRQAEEKFSLALDPVSGVAVQPVEGILYAGATPEEELACRLFNLERLAETATRAAHDRTIRALVLAFDSPGGFTRGISAVTGAFEELSIVRPSLPVLAYVTRQCESLAYWVACACDEIHASPSAVVGGIGAMAVSTDSSKFYEINGMKRRLHTGETYKGLGTPGVEWSKEWLEHIDNLVAKVAGRFKGFVKERRLSVTEFEMQGQSFEATEASTGPRNMIDSSSFPTLEQFLRAVAVTLRDPSARLV